MNRRSRFLACTALLLALGGFLVVLSLSTGFANEAPKADVPGLVSQQPASGFFVKTERGYMVPYKATIPGTDVQFEMVPVPGGKFKLGSPAGEAGRNENEGPQVEVTVEPFWMSKYEVTWAEYKQFMGLYEPFKAFSEKDVRSITKERADDIITAPSRLYDPTFTFDKGDKPRLPAVSMSQFAAKQYTKWLSRITGQFYRLPWEAEWEYACRAGSTTAFSCGDDVKQLGDYAWTKENSDDTPHEVGLKKPNAWGLYDMHGNVGEWCLDELKADTYKNLSGKTVTTAEAAVWPKVLFPRVIRGGSWDDDAALARSAARIPSNDKEWKDTDPNLPKSPWWLTDGMVHSLGMRIMRPLNVPSAKDQLKVWDSDLESIDDAIAGRMLKGSGAKGLADPELPAAIKKLDK